MRSKNRFRQSMMRTVSATKKQKFMFIAVSVLIAAGAVVALRMIRPGTIQPRRMDSAWRLG